MKRQILALCTIMCAAVFFASCSKDDTTTATINANLMFVNLSPNGSNIDATVNGNVTASNIAYPSNSGYKAVASGTSNITITQTGTSTQVLNGSVNLEGGSNYSFYVVDSSNKRKATILKDDLTAPSTGKAKVRVLHFSPNAPAVDISVAGGTSTAINMTNRMFNDVSTNASYSAFQEVDAAGLTVTVKLAGTSTVLATVPLPALTAGKIYSVIIRGFATGVGAQALGVEVIQHN